MIGRAPGFALTDQEGRRLTLTDLEGQVVVVTFIYAACTDTCPLLTAKLARLESRLGSALGARVVFVAITVDLERDTPAVLAQYARHHAVDLRWWSCEGAPRRAASEETK